MKTNKPKKPTQGGAREGAGRKKNPEVLKMYSLKLSSSKMAKIKGNKSKFVREAIDAKLEQIEIK